MADDFFDKQEQTEEVTEPEKIKLGDKEYTQEELSQKVGLGEKYQELETKFNTKLDKVVPDWSRASQEAAELRKFKEQVESERKANENKPEIELTAEQKDTARKQLVEILGYEPMKQEDYQTFRSMEKLIDDVKSTVNEAKEKGEPNTTPEELAAYMDDNGIKNPRKAYKLMFEEQLDKIKEQKLSSIKPSGINTITQTTAGSKQPKPVKVTNDNAEDLLQSIFNR